MRIKASRGTKHASSRQLLVQWPDGSSFKSEWMIEVGYYTVESAVNDIRNQVLYYNYWHPQRANQGLPPQVMGIPYQDC